MRQITNSGDLIKKMRTGRKMKLIVLASLMGVSENYIFMIERGLRVPSLKFILGFARLFQINPEWLFEKWIRDHLLREEEKIRERFQRMVLKKLPGLKLPPVPLEKFDKKSHRPLRPEWDTALTKVPVRGIRYNP